MLARLARADPRCLRAGRGRAYAVLSLDQESTKVRRFAGHNPARRFRSDCLAFVSGPQPLLVGTYPHHETPPLAHAVPVVRAPCQRFRRQRPERHFYKKLHVNCATAAVSIAIRERLLDPPPTGS
jgi:hypothetical protein